MTIIVIVVTLILCLISFWLMIKDQESQIEIGEDKNEELKPKLYSRAMVTYSIIMISVTVAIALELSYDGMETVDEIIEVIKQLVLLSLLWPLAYIDFRTYRIPNKFIILGVVYRVIILLFEFLLQRQYIGASLLSDVLAATALFVAAILCSFCVKNSIGYGDIKLFIVMGLLLGMEYIWSAVFMSLVVSFFIASYVLITRKKNRQDMIPFAPAIVLGTYLSIFLMGM